MKAAHSSSSPAARTSSRLLEGKLDEISLYDRALPTEEVLKHAKAAGLEPPPAKQSRALSPAESQKTLHLPPGLRTELVAAEPEVQSPVAMAFDERGRLWVVEMIDYPNGPKPGEPGQSRIKLLRDLDGDGRFEEARVFADKLLFANGLIPYRDGVIVTAAPEILWLRDTDDDGVCDKREVLYKGFVAGNPQLRVSHPILLPDGRICVVNGLRGGKIVRGGDNPGEPIDISGRDFAFDPRTGKAEAITGMGQYGNTLDDAGNRFVCTNRNHWIHIGLDEKYLKRNPWMAVPPRSGDNQAPGGAARIFPLTHQMTTANEHQGYVHRGVRRPCLSRHRAAAGISRRDLHLRTDGQPGPSRDPRPAREHVHRQAGPQRARVSRLDRSVVPPGVSRWRTRRRTVCHRHVSQGDRAPRMAAAIAAQLAGL